MDEPLTYIEAIVDYEGKPYLQMAVPVGTMIDPCQQCVFIDTDCNDVERALRTGRESNWPCVDNIRRREFVFIKPVDHEEFIAHMVAIRMGAENG